MNKVKNFLFALLKPFVFAAKPYIKKYAEEVLVPEIIKKITSLQTIEEAKIADIKKTITELVEKL